MKDSITPLKLGDTDPKKVCIMFPRQWHQACDLISRRVAQKLRIDCISIKFRYLARNHVSEISKLLKDGCVLVIGYEGDIRQEHFYKLGIANAFQRQVILVDLSPSKTIVKDVPEYVSYSFLIKRRDESNEYVHQLEIAISEILNKDIESMLYRKAIHQCESLEKETGVSIQKINKEKFIEKLKKELSLDGIKYGEDVLYSLYSNNDDDFLAQIIIIIAMEELAVIEALTVRAERNSELPEMQSSGNQSVYDNAARVIPQARTDLYQFVLKLPSAQLESVLFNLNPPNGNVPPSSSPKSERVTALFEWLESPIGPGLAVLRSALAKVL
jgi:hypothetical protein